MVLWWGELGGTLIFDETDFSKRGKAGRTKIDPVEFRNESGEVQHSINLCYKIGIAQMEEDVDAREIEAINV